MVRPRAFFWAIPALLFPVFGCYESSTPLGPSERAVSTPRLIGTWTCRDPGNEDNVATLRVLPFDSLRYSAEWTEKNDITRYAVHASSVGGTLLHNVKEIRADGAPTVWFFVRVAFPTDAQLQLASVKNDDLKHLSEDAALLVIRRRVRDESLYEPFAICERDEGAGPRDEAGECRGR